MRVLIVGAGPVGLVLANILKKYDVEFDIIDKSETSTTYSKALSVSPATVKVFHGLGLADKLIEKGRAIRDINFYYEGARFLHIKNNYIPSIYNFHISTPQPETERILENSLNEQNVFVKRGVELISLSLSQQPIIAKLTDKQSHQYKQPYDFVLGCDGANSIVRQQCDIKFVGRDYDMHFIMGDVRFTSDIDSLMTSYHVTKDGFLIFLPMRDNMVRLVIKKSGAMPYPKPTPTLKVLQDYLDKFYIIKLKIKEVVWSSVANFYNRMAEGKAVKGVYLAGDALHLFSPIGGQGMNTGIQDATNLAWKIAYTIKYLAKPSLLESYSTERELAVRRILNSTDTDTQFISMMASNMGSENIYLPQMKNRFFYRKILPEKYSGFSISHSRDEAYNNGKHVPFIKLDPSKINIDNTYDIPKLGKLVVFSNGIDSSTLNQLSALQNKLLVFYYLSVGESRLFSLLHLDKHEICLIRPDGYIGFIGTRINLISYMKFYYN